MTAYMIKVHGNKDLANRCIDTLVERGHKWLPGFKSRSEFIQYPLKGFLLWYEGQNNNRLDWNKLHCRQENYKILDEQQFFEKFSQKVITQDMNTDVYFRIDDLTEMQERVLTTLFKELGFSKSTDKRNGYVLYINFFKRVYTWYNPTDYKRVTFFEILSQLSNMPVNIRVQLNDSYEADVSKEGIKVGCQEFSHEKLDELHKASLEARGKN